MQKKHSLKSNSFLRLAGLLLVLVLLTVCIMSKGLYARYTTSSQGQDGARVARYVFDVTDGTNAIETLDLSDLSPDNQTKVFTIVVTNKNTSGVCEVTQKYTISEELFGSLPLSYTLKYDGATEPQKILLAGVATTHTYILTVTWNESKTVQDANANILDNASIMTVTVASEQVG